MRSLLKYKKKLLLLASFIILISNSATSQGNVFKAGETIVYELYYNWGFIWIHAGKAHFSVKSTTFKEKSCYYLSATGHSISSFDKFFLVRDTFISIVDKKTLLPEYHKRVVREDRYSAQDNYWFNQSNPDSASVITHCSRKKGLNVDTLTVKNSVTDLITAIYKIRNTDFGQIKKNQKIPFSIVIDDDDKQYDLSLKYLGKETIKMRNGDKYKCIKLRPQLIKGNVFEDEDAMTLWMTDDKNRIPVMIETKIRVGNLKVMLKRVENPKFPMDSKIKK
jgi:hypothetical protein